MSAVRFFYKYAGSCYPVGADAKAKAQARWQNARNAAQAEAEAKRRGWTFHVDDDEYQEGHTGWGEPEDSEHHQQHVNGELLFLEILLSDEHGALLESLGGICVESSSDPYIRVCKAELAYEALRTIDQQDAAQSKRVHTMGG